MIASMGGVDLQLLGLGHDGHIGFNEPNDEFDKETHCVDLTEMTIEANKRSLTPSTKFRVRLTPWGLLRSCVQNAS